LLRYDGYYVLADALEIPNLDAKSRQYTGGWVRRILLGLRRAPLPESTPGEPRWLLGYAISASVYRVGVALAIALFLADRFFALGVALAAVVVLTRVVVPLFRWIAFVLTDPAVGERRERAVFGSLGAVAFVTALLFVLPVPLRSRGEGVIWLPEHAVVRAGVEGFVAEVVAAPHSRVTAGQPLVRLHDPVTEVRLRGLEAERDVLDRRVQALAGKDRVKAEIVRQRRADKEDALARARERSREQWIASPGAGVFVLEGEDDLVGRYVQQGDVVGHVVDLAAATARVVVRQDAVALLRERTDAAWLRVAHDPGTVLPARITREVPAASDHLPTPALGTAGGGPFAVDPSDPSGTQTLETVFQFELALPATADLRAAGQRVHARFDHGAEPLGLRAYRSLRRVFLRQLGV